MLKLNSWELLTIERALELLQERGIVEPHCMAKLIEKVALAQPYKPRPKGISANAMQPKPVVERDLYGNVVPK